MTKTTDAIIPALSWFSGKAALNAFHALEMIEASEAQGSWIPGASRKVAAALTKCNVASKLARASREWLERLGVPEGASQYDEKYAKLARMGWEIAHNMYFGYAAALAKVDFKACRDACDAKFKIEVIDAAEKFFNDLSPIWARVHRLDATRPVPTFTKIGASPTVTNTLETMGVGGKVETIRVCPMHREMVEMVNPKTGKTEIHPVYILDWPEGTKHNRSIHAADSCHCHACGHRISNPFNWVPMLIDDKAGATHSMWVGRDCAETLFGVQMKGDLEIKGGKQ